MNIYDLKKFCEAMEKSCMNIASFEGRWEEAEPYWYLSRVYQSLGDCLEFVTRAMEDVKELSPYDLRYDCEDPDTAMEPEAFEKSAEQMEKAIQMATNFFITGSAKEREVKEDDLV